MDANPDVQLLQQQMQQQTANLAALQAQCTAQAAPFALSPVLAQTGIINEAQVAAQAALQSGTAPVPIFALNLHSHRLASSTSHLVWESS